MTYMKNVCVHTTEISKSLEFLYERSRKKGKRGTRPIKITEKWMDKAHVLKNRSHNASVLDVRPGKLAL